MSTYYQDPDTKSWALPSEHARDDVRLSEEVIERYVSRFTPVGGTVFDPFVGFGTTLVVAERLGRSGTGFEILPERAAYANTLLNSSEVRVGDVRSADLSELHADLVLFSPPYMNRTDPEDPLSGYQTDVQSYDTYVAELAEICRRTATILNGEGRVIVQLQNLKNEKGHTALAFDLHAAIGSSLTFLGEEVTLWDEVCYGYSHGYCLMYGRG